MGGAFQDLKAHGRNLMDRVDEANMLSRSCRAREGLSAVLYPRRAWVVGHSNPGLEWSQGRQRIGRPISPLCVWAFVGPSLVRSWRRNGFFRQTDFNCTALEQSWAKKGRGREWVVVGMVAVTRTRTSTITILIAAEINDDDEDDGVDVSDG